jgi:hypothetical protein
MVWAVGAVGAVGTALSTAWAAVTAIGGIIAAVVTSPILLAVAAVAGLAGAFLYTSGAGGQAIAWLGQQLEGLKDFASEAIGGIADALLAGDIETAAKILWVTLRIAWETGVHALEKVWMGFKLGFVTAAYSMYYGAQAAFEELTHGLTIAWVDTIAGLKSAWATFSAWYHIAVEGLANWIAKRWVDVQATFDSSIDATFQKQYIDHQTDSAMGDITKQETADKSKIEADRTAQLGQEKAGHDQSMAQIGSDYQKAIEDFEKKYNQEKGGSADELAKLWEEFHALIAAAKNAGKPAGTEPGKLGAPPGPDDFAAAAQNGQKTIGTFSGAAAHGLFGGQSTLERHAQETAKNTALIAKLIKQKQTYTSLGFGLFN